VLNAVDLQSPDYYYYYYSGSKYRGYYTDKDAPKLKESLNGNAQGTDDDEQQKPSAASS
jgi:hypothetical protein